MTRHSFIQMSKLYNVKGRISYITSHARQENLYATYRTADNSFWRNLAKECQQEFKRSNSPGKCIEARELIIALPEVYTTYEPQQVLEDFTEEFRRRYNVECVSALHHNKRKTNVVCYSPCLPMNQWWVHMSYSRWQTVYFPLATGAQLCLRSHKCYKCF